MQYVVSYIVDRYLRGDGDDFYKPEGRTIIVQANNRVEAFISAYNQLTALGNLVRTVSEVTPELIIDDNGLPRTEARFEGLAGLTSEEMASVYQAGVPKNHPGHFGTTMTHIESIQEHSLVGIVPVTKATWNTKDITYVAIERLDQLRAIKSPEFDLARLVRLCEEMNICFANECYLAVAVLTRVVLDHVPPVFGFNTFAEVVNNYRGTKSFKEQMGHLQVSSRKVADAQLHTPVRNKESVPTLTQVNFASDLDVLLAEIVRILAQ